MSIDLTYYSFSSKRADDAWRERGDQGVKKVSAESPLPYDRERSEAAEQAVDTIFTPRYDALRSRVLSKLSRSLSEYGIDSTNLQSVVQLGDEQDREEFDLIHKEHTQAIEMARADIRKEMQQEKGSHTWSRDEAIHELVELDLEYGAVSTWFEYPEFEDFIVRAIATEYNFSTSDGILTKEEWLDFITRSKEQKMDGVVRLFQKEMNLSDVDANDFLIEYLETIKPILKDLRENQDSIFYRVYGGSDGEPHEIQELLLSRAERHLKEYENLLPQIKAN